MTPKEKAEELLDEMAMGYRDITTGVDFVTNFKIAKNKYFRECALIAVNELIKQTVNTPTDYGASWTFLQQVKQEIEKL
jgi:hypothetical protein